MYLSYVGETPNGRCTCVYIHKTVTHSHTYIHCYTVWVSYTYSGKSRTTLEMYVRMHDMCTNVHYINMSAVTHVTQAKAFMYITPHIRYTNIVAYHFHVYVAPFLYLYKIRDFVDRIARRFIFCRLCVLLACLFFACSHTHHLFSFSKAHNFNQLDK